MLYRKHLTVAVLVAALCCSWACRKQRHVVTRGFYYWKTTYKPTNYELGRLQQLGVSTIYLRMFDVDFDERTRQPVPVAPVQLPAILPASFSFVPVIFITQKTVAVLTPAGIAPLAQKINGLLAALCDGSAIHPAEIQIDCDWTASSHDNYFGLLRELKHQPFFAAKTLSCTIRMHQVKYTQRSGIPPADKGLLMCYSMGDLKNPASHNSILEVREAKDYMKNIPLYPLPLDIALPIFQWCVLFRDQKFVGILRDVFPDDVMRSSLFSHVSGNRYACKTDTVWHGSLLRSKDVIRLEQPVIGDLDEVAEFATQRIARTDMNVLLFSCDSITLSKYSGHDLEEIYNSCR